VDGGEGPRRLDELDKLIVVTDDPLRAMRAREGGPKSGRLPVPVKIKDRGSRVGENKGGTRGGRRRGGQRLGGGERRTPTDNGRALGDGKRLTR
jgi:hypothetical protein